MKSVALKLLMLIAPLALCAAQQAGAQSGAAYPTKSIKLIIPFAPGGGSDFFGRVMATKLSARPGQPVLVENPGGAGGSVGAELAAKAPPDGYTILLVSNSFSVSAAVSKPSYDPIGDFVPIIRLVDTSMVVGAHPSVPAKDLKGLVAYATANPGKLSFGSSGLGGIAHLATEDFLVATGTKMVHIPYKGTGPANTALLAGEIQINIGDTGAVAELVRAGKVKALAIGGKARSKLLPSVPTSAESGYPDMKLDIWYGLLAPRGTPKAIIDRLNTELNVVLKMSDIVEAYQGRFGTPAGGSSAEFGGNVKHDLDLWKRFIARTGLKVN